MNAPATASRTFEVLVANIHGLTHGLDALAKRAARKGLAPVRYTVGKAYVTHVHTDRSKACDHLRGLLCIGCVDVARVPVTLVGDVPKFAGWAFAACLQHMDGENVVRSVPGQDLPPAFRTRGPACDHCKAVRRRNDTYVLHHDDGKLIQVGSTCLADFLGTDTAGHLAAMATYFADACGLAEGDEEERLGGGGGWGDTLLANYLPMVAWCVQEQGWVSRGTASKYDDKVATADSASTYLYDAKAREEAGVDITDQHRALAEQAAAWAENLTDHEVDAKPGDYLHNLRAIARSGLVSGRCMGLAASMVVAYQNAVGIARKRAARAEQAPSHHVGTVGKRETFAATLDFVHGYETAYGYTTILKFRTHDGALLVWKASNTSLDRECVGKAYMVKGTVKKHDEYKGEKQTVVARCSVDEVAATAVAS